jgi:hypothetical protein
MIDSGFEAKGAVKSLYDTSKFRYPSGIAPLCKYDPAVLFQSKKFMALTLFTEFATHIENAQRYLHRKYLHSVPGRQNKNPIAHLPIQKNHHSRARINLAARRGLRHGNTGNG